MRRSALSRLISHPPVVSGRDERVQEIDSGSSPEFIVEGLVTVAAKASVTGGFFAAVTPGDPRQCCFQYFIERTVGQAGEVVCPQCQVASRADHHPRAGQRVRAAAGGAESLRSEERRVGKECRSRWS